MTNERVQNILSSLDNRRGDRAPRALEQRGVVGVVGGRADELLRELPQRVGAEGAARVAEERGVLDGVALQLEARARNRRRRARGASWASDSMREARELLSKFFTLSQEIREFCKVELYSIYP